MANYKIEDIEGIGEVTGKKFRDAGVKDTDSLLAASTTPSARAKLAEATGISAAQVLKFANMADLYRISGVGADYAQLLEAAGVDTVPALARRSPANLPGRDARRGQCREEAHPPRAARGGCDEVGRAGQGTAARARILSKPCQGRGPPGPAP